MLAELIRKDKDPDEYWVQVETNLEAGRIRLLFVADVIPAELRRIVEFLNSQMVSAEVLALELRQYGGNHLTTIVPTVYGQTERATARKKVLPQNGPNYRGRESYDGIKRLCALELGKIQVGFVGGEKELRAWSIVDLRSKRWYKWDTIEDPLPPKSPGNWVLGDKFLDIVQQIESVGPSTPPLAAAPS